MEEAPLKNGYLPFPLPTNITLPCFRMSAECPSPHKSSSHSLRQLLHSQTASKQNERLVQWGERGVSSRSVSIQVCIYSKLLIKRPGPTLAPRSWSWPHHATTERPKIRTMCTMPLCTAAPPFAPSDFDWDLGRLSRSCGHCIC